MADDSVLVGLGQRLQRRYPDLVLLTCRRVSTHHGGYVVAMMWQGKPAAFVTACLATPAQVCRVEHEAHPRFMSEVGDSVYLDFPLDRDRFPGEIRMHVVRCETFPDEELHWAAAFTLGRTGDVERMFRKAIGAKRGAGPRFRDIRAKVISGGAA